MKIKGLFFPLFFILFITFGASVFPASTGPMDQVKSTVDAILGTLKDSRLDRESRRAKIRSLIDKRFDFQAMSQLALAINWKEATLQERASFVKLFSRLLQDTYMGRIEAYTDERVDYVREEIEGERAVISTLIVTKNVDIPIRYRMRRRGEEWLVYDVVIEEVSLIRNYRSTYREIVKKEGFNGLLARMEQKIKELGSTKESGGAK